MYYNNRNRFVQRTITMGNGKEDRERLRRKMCSLSISDNAFSVHNKSLIAHVSENEVLPLGRCQILQANEWDRRAMHYLDHGISKPKVGLEFPSDIRQRICPNSGSIPNGHSFPSCWKNTCNFNFTTFPKNYEPRQS